MICIVLKELPFAKAGEEVGLEPVDDKNGNRGTVGWMITCGFGETVSWVKRWGDLLKDGWLAEKKPSRWMPNRSEPYFFVDSTGEIDSMRTYDSSYYRDEYRAKFYNAFQTKSQAEGAAKVVKDALEKYNVELEAASVGRKADFSHAKGTSMCDMSDCQDCKKRGAAECHC